MTVPAGIADLVRVDGECWIWRGTDPCYGPYKLIYLLLVGPIGSGKHLHHACVRPACVNPRHLVAMTRSAHRKEHVRLAGAAA